MKNVLNAGKVMVVGDVALSMTAVLYLVHAIATRSLPARVNGELGDMDLIGVGGNIGIILATASCIGLLALIALLLAVGIDPIARRRSTGFWAIAAVVAPPLALLAVYLA